MRSVGLLILFLVGVVCCLNSCKQDDDVSDIRIEFTAPDESTLLASPVKLGDSLNFQFRVRSESEVLFVSCRFIRIDEANDPSGQYTWRIFDKIFYEMEEPVIDFSFLLEYNEDWTDATYRDILNRDPSTLIDRLIIEVITEDFQKEFAYEFTNMSW